MKESPPKSYLCVEDKVRTTYVRQMKKWKTCTYTWGCTDWCSHRVHISTRPSCWQYVPHNSLEAGHGCNDDWAKHVLTFQLTEGVLLSVALCGEMKISVTLRILFLQEIVCIFTEYWMVQVSRTFPFCLRGSVRSHTVNRKGLELVKAYVLFQSLMKLKQCQINQYHNK